MGLLTVTSWLQFNPQLSYNCPHKDHLLESYDLCNGELLERMKLERGYHVVVEDVYDAVSTAVDEQQQQQQLQQAQQEKSIILTAPENDIATISTTLSQTRFNHTSANAFSRQSSHPSHVVIVETWSDPQLQTNMVGGWNVDGHRVSRMSEEANLDDCVNKVPILYKDIWRGVLEYCDPIYKRASPHHCERRTVLGIWENKYTFQPSEIFNDYILATCKEKATLSAEKSGYQQFSSNGAGWKQLKLLNVSESWSLQNGAQSTVHDSSENEIILTAASVAAYRKYFNPNILDAYQYDRPPFRLPTSQGLLYHIPLELDIASFMSALQLQLEDQVAPQITLPSFSLSGLDVTNESENEDLASSSSYHQNPVLGNETPSLHYTSRFSTSSAISSSSNASVDNYLSPYMEPANMDHTYSPTRTFSPSISASYSQTYSSTPFMQNSQQLSPKPNSIKFANSDPQLPADVLFNRTWSLGETIYRHGYISIASDYLGCEIPISLCPWDNIKSVKFAILFGIDNSRPQPALILTK